MQSEPGGAVVLVVGGRGFLGAAICARLRQHGHRVLPGVRAPEPGGADQRHCNLAAMAESEDWDTALTGVDVVVNVAGILRETRTQTFEAVHVAGPLALANACVARGIRRFVQVSALGDPRDGDFIASKHRFDAALLQLPLQTVVLRPSVVYSPRGSHGGTSLLRALAALPLGVWLPGDGCMRMQPVDATDLAELVARAVAAPATGTFEVGGPEPLSLGDYQRRWRRWLRIPGERAIHVPLPVIAMVAWLGERIGRGPLGATIWRMLRRGNVTAPDAGQRLVQAFGFAPRGLDDVLRVDPSHVQDRWQARLYFLAPALRFALVALWVLSGVAGLLTPASTVADFAAPLSESISIPLARLAGGMDLAFALWLLAGWRSRLALAGMAASVAIYTVIFSLWSPASWLEPLGGMAKNLVVLPAIAVLWVLDERR